MSLRQIALLAKEKCKIFIDLPDPINAGDWLPRSNNMKETIVAGHSTITVSHCSGKKNAFRDHNII